LRPFAFLTGLKCRKSERRDLRYIINRERVRRLAGGQGEIPGREAPDEVS